MKWKNNIDKFRRIILQRISKRILRMLVILRRNKIRLIKSKVLFKDLLTFLKLEMMLTYINRHLRSLNL